MIGRSGRSFQFNAVGAGILALLLAVGLGVSALLKPTISSPLLLRRAAAAIEAKDFAAAARFLDDLLQREPANHKALLFRGEVAQNLQEPAAAVEYWSRVPDDAPRDAAIARCLAGMLAYVDYRARDAEALFVRSKQLDPAYLVPRERLAHLYKLQLRDAELRGELFEIRQMRPLSLEELSRTAGNMGKIHPAPIRISDLENLIAKDAHDVTSIVALAECYLSESRFDDATKLLDSAFDQNANDSSLRGLLVEALLQQNAAERAAELLDGSLPTEVDAVWLWRAHADYRMSIGDWETAVRFFERAVTLDPNDIPTTYNYGLTLQRVSRDAEAMQVIERARLMDQIVLQVPRVRSFDSSATQTLFPIVLEVGRLLIELGRSAEAVVWLEQALEWNQTDRMARELFAKAAQRAPHEAPAMAPHRAAPGVGKPDSRIGSRDVARVPQPGRNTKTSPGASHGTRAEPALRFSDRHMQSGLEFQYFNGDSGLKYIVESTGGGVAVLDFDGDGWPDLFFPQGCKFPLDKADAVYSDRLFRNMGGIAFADVSASALERENQYGQGGAAADYDNDGFIDLAVANFGTVVIYRNNGDGTLADVTRFSGIDGEHWSTSLAWGDLDRDGNLDLVVVNYARDTIRICRKSHGEPTTCSPRAFPADDDVLYVSRGDGTFADCTQASGLVGPDGRGLGIVIADFDQDGWPDIYIANDGTPAFLFHNETSAEGGPLHLVERGLLSGAAVNGKGFAQAGMGVACGDFNGDLLLDLVTTNFYLESTTLFQNQGNLQFIDATRTARLDEPTRLLLGFGTQAIDADLDGRLDLFIANGHINDNRERGEPWKMPPLLMYNLGQATFSNRSLASGSYFAGEYLGRGVSRLDWNRDGLPDLVVVHQDRPAALLSNETLDSGRRLILELHGVESNRDAIGARVTLTGDGIKTIHEVCGGDGFMASNERRVILGLGSAAIVEQLEIRWPSGRIDRWTDIPADSELTLIEGKVPDIRPHESVRIP